MRPRFLPSRVAVAALALACTTTPSVGTDAGIVLSPAAPAAPTLTPCPAGWRAIGADPVVCDPWPEGGWRSECAFDEVHFPGTPGCARVGTACAADGWPSDLPGAAAILYVDVAAAAGGDGTRPRPFSSITAALAAAPADAVVALHTGAYDEDLVLDRGITLWGACVSGTRLTSSRANDGDVAVVEIHGIARVRNLALDHPLRYGLLTRGGGAEVRDVVVDGARGEGLWAESGGAEVHGSAFRHVVATSEGWFGRGIEASTTTSLSNQPHIVLDRVVVDDCMDVGMLVSHGASLEGHDVLVARTRVGLQSGVALGVVGDDPGTHLALTRVAFEANAGDAFAVANHSSAELTDLAIRDGATPVSLTTGLVVRFGASATVSRAWIHDIGLGMGTGESDSSLTATDVVLVDLVGGGTLLGRGAGAQNGATLHVSRALVARVASDAFLVGRAGSRLALEDVTIRDVASDPTGRGGFGVSVEEDAVATLARVSIERAGEVGMFASLRGRIEAEDVRITDVLGNAQGTFGAGTIAQDDAFISLTRGAIAHARVVGAGSVVRSTMSLTDVSIDDVRAGCFDPGCTTPVGGYGLAGYRGASLSVQRFAVARSQFCGVIVGDDEPPALTAVDLSEGTISTAAIGACVQVAGFDVERLHDRVAYVDVEVPLQATSYPLPGAIGGP